MTHSVGSAASSEERPRQTFWRHLTRRRPRCLDGDPQVSELGDGHGPAHIGQESGNDAIPECRMRKRILVDSVTVHQATSRLMKKERIHCKTRDIRPKSSQPDATGHSPWWKELGTRSSGQRRSIPHALQSNVPDMHGPNLSTRRTTRPGNATVEPIPDGMQTMCTSKAELSFTSQTAQKPGA